MQYTTDQSLSLDDQHILENKVLPTAKSWVMQYGPNTTLHQRGLATLRYWNVKDDDLRRRMMDLARTDEKKPRAGSGFG